MTEPDIISGRAEVLRREVEAIRGRIKSLGYLDGRLEDQEGLKALLENHNSLVEELNLSEEPPRYDPIERLPYELWVKVLEEALLKERYGCVFISTEISISLTSVSSKWRHSIRSTPHLWSDIVVDDHDKSGDGGPPIPYILRIL